MDAIDTALVGHLAGDVTLTALAPGGVHFDLAPSGVTDTHIVVSQEASEDEYVVGRADRRFDDRLYQVKAVSQSTTAAAADAAAARVEALLTGATLTPTGYSTLNIERAGRIRYVEPEGDRRWQHSGGSYRVEMLKV